MPFIRAAVLAERLLEDREARKAKSEQAGDTPALIAARCLSIAARAVTTEGDFAVINVAPSTIIPARSRATHSKLIRIGKSLLAAIPVTSLRRR